MTLLNFVPLYLDEYSYWIKFNRQGVLCLYCRHDRYYWKGDKESCEGKKYGKRQSLRTNIVMHGSQLSFRYWFIVINLLNGTEKNFSACQSGHKYYEAMAHLLGKRDEKYNLSGILELDGGSFTARIDDKGKARLLKRGSGIRRKSRVSVMVESEPDVDDDGKVSSKKTSQAEEKSRRVGHIKIIVTENLKSEAITSLVKANVSKESVIDSDDSCFYGNIENAVKGHHLRVISKENTDKILYWIYITISNAKKQLLNIYPQIDFQYLQSYFK